MASQELQHRFHHDGFVVVREFLPSHELASLQTELDRYIREIVPSLPQGDAFFVDRARPETLKQLQHMDVDPFFRDYARNSRWCELAQRLLGEPASCDAPEWFDKPPGTQHETPPHQDNFYFCLRPPQVITMWLALDPVDEENGGLCYLPGSHRRGIRPHAASAMIGFSQAIVDYDEQDRAAEVRVKLSPGDLVVHHGETIHRADPNRSATRHRRALAMVFRGASAQRDEQAYARYLQALDQQHEQLLN